MIDSNSGADRAAFAAGTLALSDLLSRARCHQLDRRGLGGRLVLFIGRSGMSIGLV